MKTLDTLPTHAQDWTRVALKWADQYFDPKYNLLTVPDDADRPRKKGDKPRHPVRATVWYVTGLLLRQQGDDVQRAEAALRAVLTYQYRQPEAVFHGTFKRSPEEADAPLDRPVEWVDYDPNWREFICTVFIIVLDEFSGLLPDDLIEAMMDSIKTAAEGAYARKVDPAYTNIALMSAFLLDYAGLHFDNPVWRDFGAAMAQQTTDLFYQHKTYSEYNSPTYYGVDAFALALWREYGLTEHFRDLGTAMEADFFRDVARYYHAGMRNLCGPYDRAYGMDMTTYLAVFGLNLACVLPRDLAPLPDPGKVFGHSADFYFMPPIALLPPEIPQDVLMEFMHFTGERHFEQRIDADRVATAWLSESVMIGAETQHPRTVPNQQFHPATIHWQMPNGKVGWLRLRCDEHIDAHAEPGKLIINGRGGFEIRFEAHVVRPKANMIASDVWKLPGLKLMVKAQGTLAGVEVGKDSLTASFAFSAAVDRSAPLITFTVE